MFSPLGVHRNLSMIKDGVRLACQDRSKQRVDKTEGRSPIDTDQGGVQVMSSWL